MKNFILVLFSFVAVACSSLRQVTPTEKIVTETRVETVFQTDTVFLEVPKIVERIVTKDTVSVLENEFAKSAASVSDGLLAHSLETKPVQKPVEVQTKIVYRDSVIFKDVVVYETVEVEKEHMDRVRLGFNQVVTNGLGYGYMGNYHNSSGKTGTSQSFIDTDGNGVIDTETITSSFLGYAPYDNPKMSILVTSPDSSHPNSYTDFALNLSVCMLRNPCLNTVNRTTYCATFPKMRHGIPNHQRNSAIFWPAKQRINLF